MNTAMVLLAIGTIVIASLYFVNKKEDHGWAGTMVKYSSAAYPSPGLGHKGDGEKQAEPVGLLPDQAQPGSVTLVSFGAEGAVSLADEDAAAKASGTLFGYDPFKIMYYVSAVLGLFGIIAAAWFHGPKGLAGLGIGNRVEPAKVRMDAIAARFGPIPRWAENKWYVDEFYHAIVVKPLLVASHVFHAIDKLVIDGIVDLLGSLPRFLGSLLRPSQSGVLHSYATGMVAGSAVLVALIVLVALL